MPSVWRHERNQPHIYGNYYYKHSLMEHCGQRTSKNVDLDDDTKSAALKLSQSIVSLVSHSGQELLFACTGTVTECEECEESKGTFISTILTSASLLGVLSEKAATAPASDIRVDVYLWDGKLLEGWVSNFDLHLNICNIKIRFDSPLPVAVLRHFDGSMSVNPSALHAPGDMVDCNLFKLCHGDKVVALGRHYLSFKLMVAPGEFSGDGCNFDCKELSRANCIISKSAIGGPLINYDGEVIGVNFYAADYTPFLPINIVSKCLEHWKKYPRVRHPRLGMIMIDLYLASVGKLEKIIQKFPNIYKGVIVEEVEFGSPAYSAGIRGDDVIIQCDGNFVGCSLKFHEIIWEKARESVEVVVLRAETGASLNLTLVADEISTDEYNKWPVPRKRLVPCALF